MARVPKKDWGPEFRKKTSDQEHPFQTMDGTEYILYIPSFRQYEAYAKSLKKYKDVFEQIKADIKDDDTIAKSKGDGLPKDLDHVEWAALLSFTLKKLNKTWGVNDKIWIYNKEYDDKKSTPMYLAITPKITQRNAIRSARKVSAAAATATADDDDDGYIDADNITFGPMLAPLTRPVYTRTKNGLTYYYNTKEDAENYNHYKIENSDEELVNESGKRINPDGTLMKFIRKSDFDKRQERKRSKRDWAEKQIEMGNDLWLDDYDTSREPSEGFITEDEAEYEGESEEPNYYDEDNPPDDEAIWDDEFKSWVYPLPQEMYEMYDEKDNVEPEPAPMPPPAPMPALPTEDPSIVAARIGLPAGWEPLISRSTGRIYYYNKNTGNKQYEVPTDDPRIAEASIGLPAGWVPLISRSTGRIYFYNQTTGKKQFERPTMGGKRTRRRSRSGPRPKSRTKQPKKKRITTRRKRTTRRRK
jgi:hypothetical protein